MTIVTEIGKIVYDLNYVLCRLLWITCFKVVCQMCRLLLMQNQYISL